MATLTPELRREWIASRQRLLHVINERIQANQDRLGQIAALNERTSPQYRQSDISVTFMLDTLKREKERLESEIAWLKEAA